MQGGRDSQVRPKRNPKLTFLTSVNWCCWFYSSYVTVVTNVKQSAKPLYENVFLKLIFCRVCLDFSTVSSPLKAPEQ